MNRPMTGTAGRPRRGKVLVFAMMLMPLLLVLCTLAVDWGRVQLVKTELERATQAAARAAVPGTGRGGGGPAVRRPLTGGRPDQNPAGFHTPGRARTTGVRVGTGSGRSRAEPANTLRRSTGVSATRRPARHAAPNTTGPGQPTGTTCMAGRTW